MSESEVLSSSFLSAALVGDSDAAAAPAAPATRKRPKPGERREQILQALATMLEKPGAERIT
ncbi:MAG: nucleoid occlusion factor SlmA, partial [Comamonas sp.]